MACRQRHPWFGCLPRLSRSDRAGHAVADVYPGTRVGKALYELSLRG